MKQHEIATPFGGTRELGIKTKQGGDYMSLGMDAKLLGGLYFVVEGEGKMCGMCDVTCERLSDLIAEERSMRRR
jgi:hypothetical protein